MFASGLSRPDAGELHFQTAEIGMEIFTNTVGSIDTGPWRETEFGCTQGHVPSDCACSCTIFLSDFKAQMAFLHDARCGDEACVAGHEDGFWIAVAEGLEFAQPPGQDCSDLMQRQLGMDAKFAFGFARGETFGGALGKAALQLRQGRGRQGKANGEGVAAKSCEQIGTGLDC